MKILPSAGFFDTCSRRSSLSPVGAALMALALPVLISSYAEAANTEMDVINGQSDLFLSGSYSPSGVPAVTSDVNFTNVAYSPAAFTLSGNITVGSLNDSRNGTSLSISNSSGSAKTITLGGAGDLGNSVSGVAADLLFVANGGNLTLTGGSGTTALGLVLGQTGNFDVQGNGSLTVSSVISDGSSGFGFTKTGSGTLNLGAANTYTGATTIAQGTLNLDYNSYSSLTAFTSSSSALVMGGTASGGGTINDSTPILSLQGANGTNKTQTFNGFTANAGANQITVRYVNANLTLALGAVTNSVGGTVNFSRDTNGGAGSDIITTTSSNDASGILGGWAVINATPASSTSAQAPTDYAAVSGGNIVAYTGYTPQAAGAITSSTTSNAQVSATGSVALTTTASATTDLNTLSLASSATGATTVTIGSGGILRLGANGGMLTAAGSGSITLNGGTLTAGGAANTAGVINLIGGGGGSPFTINSVIADNGTGAVSLVYSQYASNGNLTLGGANTYSGGTYINKGRLQVNTNTAFGTGAVTVLSGGQAYLNSSTFANNFNIEGGSTGGNDTPSAIRLQGGQTLSGKITLLGDANIAFGGTDTVTGQITGSYGMNWGRAFGSGAGVGTVTLANVGTASNYTGNTTITEGTVKLGASDQIPDGASAGNLVISNSVSSNGVFDLNGFSDTINGLTGVSTATVKNGAAGTSVLTVGANNATATYAGTISNTTGTLGITKTGTGTQTLTGTNSYGGVTTVNGGTLKFTTSLTGTGAVNVNGGGTLNTAGTAISIGGAITVAGGSTGATQGTITLVGNNLATDVLTFGNAGGVTLGGTAGNASNLGFDVLFSGGLATADKIAVTNGLTVNAGGSNILINGLGGVASGQTYTLMTFGSGTGSGFATGSGATVGGFTLANTALSFGVTGALNVTGTTLQLVTGGAAAPATAYWSGAQGTTWASVNGGNTQGNFTTDAAGTSFVAAYPASTTDVIFAATNATNLTNTLGANFDIKSLTFLGTGPTASTATTITGANSLSVESGGITLNSGNAGVTLGMTGIGLGTSQSWTNNSSNAFIVSSNTAIVGNATSGTTTLTLSNTGTGTTTINGTIGNGAGTNTVAVVVNNTGTGAGATTTFANANTYSGGTTIGSGSTLIDNSGGTTGFGANVSGSVINIASGGTAQFNANGSNLYNYTFAGGGKLKFNFIGGSDTSTASTSFNGFTGIVELANNGTNNKLIINGQTGVSGATLQIDNGAQAFVTSNTTNFGAITIVGGGNGEFRGAIRLNAGTLGGNISLLGNTTIGNEGGTLTGNISTGVAGTSVLTMGTFNSGGTALLSGILSDGTGTLGLTQSNGTTTLSNANTFTGDTNVTGGTLKLTNGLALQNSTLASGTVVFDSTVSSHAFTFGGLNGSANIVLADNAGSPNAVSLTIGNNNAATPSYSGILSGAGSLTKIGTNQQTLSGLNTYTGGTKALGGVLIFNQNFTMSGANRIDITGSGGVGGTDYAIVATGAASPTLTFGGTLQINITASLAAGGDPLQLFDTRLGGALAGNFSSVSISGTYVASLTQSGSDWLGTNGGLSFDFSAATGALTIGTSAIPEPATYAAILGGLTLAVAAWRRRQKRIV